MSGWLVRPHGPERVAVARALEATATRSASVGTTAESHARHGAAVAIQRAWQAVGAGRSTSRRAVLEALVAHAETAMREARHASDIGSGPPGGAEDELRRSAGAAASSGGGPGGGDDPGRGRRGRRDRAAPPGGAPPAVRLGRLNPSAPFLPLAIRVAVAAAVAGILAHLVGLGHTSWAAVSAVAVLQSVDLTTTVNRGIQRALGTATGVILGVTALAFSPGPVAAVILVIVFQVLAG